MITMPTLSFVRAVLLAQAEETSAPDEAVPPPLPEE